VTTIRPTEKVMDKFISTKFLQGDELVFGVIWIKVQIQKFVAVS